MTFAAPILTDDPSWIVLGDVVRLLCAVGAAGLIGFAAGLVVSYRRPLGTQRVPIDVHSFIRLTCGLIILSTAVLLRELERVGQPVTVYLPIHLLGIGVGLWGAAGLLVRGGRR